MKVLNKKFASLAVAAVMTAGGIGIANFVASNHATASADTGIVSIADTGSIGMGETNKATVSVSSTNPATLTVKDVKAGQYYLMLKVPNGGLDYWLSISAQVGDDYAYPSYNSYADAYIALVTVSDGTEIVLTSYSDEAETVDVYLGEVFIGASTDNSVYGLRIAEGTSRTMQLADVAAGNYIVRVQTYDLLDKDAKFYAQLNGAAVELKYDDNMFGYVANVEIGAATKSLTVSTTNGDFISVDVYLNAVVTINTPLPMKDAATFTQYEAQSFVYKADKTGYFTISANSTTENAEFSYELKTNPNNLVSSIIPDSNFPMYFVEGQNYYFTITYSGLTDTWDAPATVDATFSLNKWQTPTVALNEMVYAPITVDGKTEAVNITGEVGTTYIIGFTNAPFDVEHIYIHYAGEIITVDGMNGFNGEITIEKDYDTIYFTTDYNAEFVAGVTLSYVPVDYDDEIKLNAAKEITLRAHETLQYFVYNLPEGAYEVTLTDGNGNVTVTDVYDNTLINRGANKGFFTVETYGEETGTGYLYFTNDSDSAITFSVTVTKGETIALGEATDISLTAAENSKTYYVTGLTAGAYRVVITANPGTFVSVTLNGEPFMGYFDNEKEFTIDIDEWLTTAVSLTFTGFGNFSVLVTPAE